MKLSWFVLFETYQLNELFIDVDNICQIYLWMSIMSKYNEIHIGRLLNSN